MSNEPGRPTEPDPREALQQEEEASDRARGRTPGPGQAPKLGELRVPHPKDAPEAPADGD